MSIALCRQVDVNIYASWLIPINNVLFKRKGGYSCHNLIFTQILVNTVFTITNNLSQAIDLHIQEMLDIYIEVSLIEMQIYFNGILTMSLFFSMI